MNDLGKVLYEIHAINVKEAHGINLMPWDTLLEKQKNIWRQDAQAFLQSLK